MPLTWRAVLYLDSPPGVSVTERRNVLDAIDKLNQQNHSVFGNPETVTRIAQYEMSFRMQMDATDAMDIHKEPESVRTKYGSKIGESSFANNCLVARRLAERGVRFIQLYHWGWDSHGIQARPMRLNDRFRKALPRERISRLLRFLSDLKDRGMLEDTLVVWGGEFGRTSMRENRSGQVTEIRRARPQSGRRSRSGWLVAASKPGMTLRPNGRIWATKSFRTQWKCETCTPRCCISLGFDHRKLNYPFQGLDQKLTGVKPARVVGEILA